MNRYKGEKKGALVQRVITIASPMGGHPSARIGGNAPLVLPAWRDISPDSTFIHHLYRRPLPESVGYHLFYAYGNDSSVKIGENSDGVVPMSSQLAPQAQNEATRQYGINDTHIGILKNRDLISQLLNIVYEVKPAYSPALLAELIKGGYTVELSEDSSAMEKYFIRYYAYFFEALTSGKVAPENPPLEHFVKACRGEVPATTPAETAWIKYRKEHREK